MYIYETMELNYRLLTSKLGQIYYNAPRVYSHCRRVLEKFLS